jgi:hypothetical protein
VYNRKAKEGVEVQRQSFITSRLDRTEWLDLCFGLAKGFSSQEGSLVMMAKR